MNYFLENNSQHLLQASLLPHAATSWFSFSWLGPLALLTPPEGVVTKGHVHRALVNITVH